MRGSWMVVVAALAVSGCVGNDGFQGLPDAGPDAAPLGSLYDEPSDFDLSGCEGDPIDPASVAGFWNVQIAGEDTANEQSSKLRLDSIGPDVAGYLGSMPLEGSRLEDDVLFVRTVEGERLVIAAAFCGAGPDGTLVGRFAICVEDYPCSENEAVAYPVRPLDEPEADGMSLVGSWTGPTELYWPSVELVRHRGEIGYVLSSFDGLSVVDLSDPASPVELGWIPTGEGQFVEDIELPPGQGTLAYLAAGERGIVIADLGDPANPVEVGTFPEEPVGVWDLALDGERLYAVTSDGVQVFDVSDPASPEALGLREATADFFPATVAAADGAVALADSLNAIELVDMTDPELPVDLGRLETADSLYGQRTSLALTEADERTVAVSSQEHFGGRVAVIDVEPGAPAEISSYQTRPQVRIGGVTVTGDLALVAYQEDGLRLLDLSDPESPVEVGHFRSFLGTDPADGLAIRDGAVAADVDLERGLVLLADATRGLLVLSLDDPLVLAALRR